MFMCVDLCVNACLCMQVHFSVIKIQSVNISWRTDPGLMHKIHTH